VKKFLICLALACGPSAFDPIGDIESVRVLAAAASEPYAKPGDSVTVTLDAWDGRPPPADGGMQAPMSIYWLPFVCEDPQDDLYYACFSSLVAPGGAGDGGVSAQFPPNLDITDFLQEGVSASFTMPSDVITSHAFVDGLPEQYGVVFLFAMACAGRVHTLPIDPSAGNGQTVPLGCFDGAGNQLGPDDYVFTFTRVYAYEMAENQNPVINGVVFDGQNVDLNAGVVVDHCDENANDSSCNGHAVNVTVPDSDWEIATGTPLEPDGTQLHEEIWADYYYTLPNTQEDGILLFDARTGRVSDSDNQYLTPESPGQGRLFIVVHDSRGGASWVDFPIVVR
jgi:hypothetical protein